MLRRCIYLENNNPLISICCFAYNHEKYICEAIESFLMQKINVKYEILIHDDASTDNTSNIIRGYEQKYPDIIKVVYQKENLFSQGKNIHKVILDRVKGKYVAFCEGDDYWTDPYKLQKQLEFMELNEAYSLCGHTTKIKDNRNNFVLGYYGDSGESREIAFRELMRGHAFHFSSMFFRANLWQMNDQSFIKNAFVGDYAFCLWLGTLGRIYCINEEMSVYRKYVEHSWTSINTNTLQNQIDIHLNLIKMFKDFNSFTNEKYKHLVSEAETHNIKIIHNLERQLIDMPCRLLTINSMDDYYFLRDLEDVYIFGTGEYGQKVNSYFLTINKNMKGFIDNNLDIIGKFIQNKIVYNISDVDKYANILICSSWYKEIYFQLKNLGYQNIYVMNPVY